MARWEITFTQYYTYSVEAETEDDAFKLAEKEFDGEMHYPVARTHYDDCEINCIEDNEQIIVKDFERIKPLQNGWIYVLEDD